MTSGSSNANITVTLTSKTPVGFNYVISCTYQCGDIGTVTIDFRLYHP